MFCNFISTVTLIAGEEMKKKWKNMRDCYMKYLRDCKTTTGQAKKNYKKWTWATQMERFKPFIGMAKTMSNVTAPEIEGNNTNHDEFADEPDEMVGDGGDNQEMPNQEESINTNVARNCPTPTAIRYEPAAKRRKPNTSGSNVDKVVQYLEGKNKPVFDATDHLMLGYSKTIKTFTRARQAEVKLKIAQIINQAELEQIHEENISRPSSSSTGSWEVNHLTDTELEEQRARVYERFATL